MSTGATWRQGVWLVSGRTSVHVRFGSLIHKVVFYLVVAPVDIQALFELSVFLFFPPILAHFAASDSIYTRRSVVTK